MRPVTQRFLDELEHSHRRGGFILLNGGESVPFTDGAVIFDASSPAVRRATFTVPIVDAKGKSWDPATDPEQRLSVYGNRVVIYSGVIYSDGTRDTVSLGQYLITDVATDHDRGVVDVTCSDLFQLVEDCPIILNLNYFLGWRSSFRQVAERLIRWEPTSLWPENRDILPQYFDPALDDRSTWASFIDTRDATDRTEQLRALAEAWPARYQVADNGDLTWYPPLSGPKSTPDLTIWGGTVSSTMAERGTVARRAGFHNAIFVRGIDPDTGKPKYDGKAFRDSGPLDYRGPFGLKPDWYQSTNIQSDAEAQQIAEQLLAAAVRESQTQTVEIVPNPAIELHDTVELVITDSPNFKGLVTGYRIPLTAQGGTMTLTVARDVGL